MYEEKFIGLHLSSLIYSIESDNMKNREKKFIELAEKRMTHLIKQIKLVGNLANKSNYIYTDKQANKIIKTLNDELNDVKQKFRNGKNNKQTKFKL